MYRNRNLALSLVLGGMGVLAAGAMAANPTHVPAEHALLIGAQPRGDWNTPPTEFNDIQRRGFRDGMIGAQRDFQNHRRPDPNNRDEFRRPNVPPRLRNAYRQGFQRGYARAVAHLQGRPWR